MSETPLKQHLRDTTPDPARVEEMWEAVRSRTERPRARRMLFVGLALAPALALLVLRIIGGSTAAGPLRLADAQPLSIVDQLASAPPVELSLEDGSRVTLDDGARLEPLLNDGQRLELKLERGRARFSVKPGGPRRWVIEAGLVGVEVVGTRFVVRRGPDRVEVTVDEGVVLVRGERVPGRVQRLVAGGAITVEEAIPAAEAGPARGAAAGTPDRVEPARPAEAKPARPEWRRLAGEQRYREAFDALGPGGPQAAAAAARDAEALLALADVARLSGHPAQAAEVLDRLITRHPADALAPLAAFTLGRVAADQLHDPARAAGAFARAVALDPPRSLAEDAYARLVETYLRSGDRAAAERVAAEYGERFPDGRHAERIRAWLSAKWPE